MFFGYSKKILVAGLVIILSVCFIGIWWWGTHRSVDVMRFHLSNFPTTLDPAKFTSTTDYLLGNAFYQGLVSYQNGTLEPIPAIAEGWEISDDGRFYTFKLRRNVRFHSGRQLTASDVKYSWERVLKLKPKPESAYLFEEIEGVQALSTGSAEEVTGIKVIDKYTLEIQLKEPNYIFPSYLGNPVFFIVDREVVEEMGEEYGQPSSGIGGCGPFTLKSWDQEGIKAEKHRRYYQRNLFLDGINFVVIRDSQIAYAEFLAGKLDFLDQVPFNEIENIKRDPAKRQSLLFKPVLSTYYYGFNFGTGVFTDNNLLRQAFNYAIDRKQLIERVSEGMILNQNAIVPAGIPDYRSGPQTYIYNLETARELFARAGYPFGNGLPEIVLSFNQGEGHEMVARGLKEQLELVGVKVRLEEMDWADYQKELKNGKKDILRLGWQADYPHPDSFLFYNFHSSTIGSTNVISYNNKEVDEILNRARRELDGDKSLDLYRQVEQKLISDAVILPLFQKQCIKMIGNRVEGLRINAMEQINFEGIRSNNKDLKIEQI